MSHRPRIPSRSDRSVHASLAGSGLARVEMTDVRFDLAAAGCCWCTAEAVLRHCKPPPPPPTLSQPLRWLLLLPLPLQLQPPLWLRPRLPPRPPNRATSATGICCDRGVHASRRRWPWPATPKQQYKSINK